MTLGEKFGEVYIGRGTFEDECEKIADDFAIEFAEWIVDYTFNGCYGNDVSELLEEFKKEKNYGTKI